MSWSGRAPSTRRSATTACLTVPCSIAPRDAARFAFRTGCGLASTSKRWPSCARSPSSRGLARGRPATWRPGSRSTATAVTKSSCGKPAGDRRRGGAVVDPQPGAAQAGHRPAGVHRAARPTGGHAGGGRVHHRTDAPGGGGLRRLPGAGGFPRRRGRGGGRVAGRDQPPGTTRTRAWPGSSACPLCSWATSTGAASSRRSSGIGQSWTTPTGPPSAATSSTSSGATWGC